MANNTSAIGKGINTLDTLFSGVFTKIVVAIVILLMGFIIGIIDLFNEGLEKFAEALGITGTFTLGNA